MPKRKSKLDEMLNRRNVPRAGTRYKGSGIGDMGAASGLRAGLQPTRRKRQPRRTY